MYRLKTYSKEMIELDCILMSFIIPVYNTDLILLNRCLNSILVRNEENYEILVIDDGSNEQVSNECDRLSIEHHNISVFHQKNQGVSVARNTGINNAKGKYIIFVDPDDYISYDFFEYADNFNFEESEIIVFDYMRELSNKRKELIELSKVNIILNKNGLVDNILFGKNYYPHFFAGSVWGKAFKRTFLLKNKLCFDRNLRKAQDRIFMLHAFSLSENIKYVKLNSYCYYQNIESICNSYNQNASSRSHDFYQAARIFIDENITDKQYSIILKNRLRIILYFEILYLDYFNCLNMDNWAIRKKKAINEYMNFEIDKAVKVVDSNEFSSLNEKIKYYLIKYRLFLLLSKFISYRQKNHINIRGKTHEI